MTHGSDKCDLALHVLSDRSATARLFCGGSQIAEAAIPITSNHLSFWGLDIGRDPISAVSHAYSEPFAYPETHLDRIVMKFFDEINEADMAISLEASE
ncbi:hypothetical protein [Pseudooceanicola spongiae]|uniref:Uncharacterized protein n=1 Tax=Pseudooceanicola spongiae TaxID=2613965 RepID=A0A7L9WJE3_9RHOB|nr:hypothetical protein [Pseudooceanicola spongiae]QOL79668.1 hypothetical protein F3W81_01810 [Pseudooceanicola spongiae]